MGAYGTSQGGGGGGGGEGSVARPPSGWGGTPHLGTSPLGALVCDRAITG